MRKKRISSDSAMRMINVHLSSLPHADFKISVDKHIMNYLLKKINLHGRILYSMLNSCASQQKKKKSTIKPQFLHDWSKGRRVPLDCFVILCSLARDKVEKYQRAVVEVNSGSSKNTWKTKFPITLDPAFFTLSEAIRVEGNIMKERFQGIAISNKDIQLLQTIEDIVKEKGVDASCFSRILQVHVYLNDHDVIAVLDKNINKNKYYSVKNDRLIFVEKIDNYNIKKNYMLVLKNGKQIRLSIGITDNLVTATSDSIGCAAFIQLQIYNSVFAKALRHLFKIPVGIGNRKSYEIEFPFDLNSLSDDVLKSVISIVLNCEAHVRFLPEKGDRSVKIKMASKKYLDAVQLMLLRFGIESKIKPTPPNLHELSIRRRKNLIKLDKITKWYILYKKNILHAALKSYSDKRFTHYEADRAYLTCLQKHSQLTSVQMSKILERGINGVRVRLNKLYKQGLVKRYRKKRIGRSTTPYIYSVINS